MGHGGSEGPFGIDELRERIAAGHIDHTTLVWSDGMSDWQPLASVPELATLVRTPGPAPPPAYAGPPPYRPGADVPELSYVGPILATVLCCVIGGIISIVYTATGNTSLARGDVAGYERAKRARNGWMIAAVAVGGIFSILYLVLMIVAGVSGP